MTRIYQWFFYSNLLNEHCSKDQHSERFPFDKGTMTLLKSPKKLKSSPIYFQR
jgi:hypothetical protein